MNDLRVLKVGGNELDDAARVQRLVAALAAEAGAGGRLVLVHGGGKEVSAVQRLLGAEPVWHEGLRVTTPEVLMALRMVLSGLVNKRLVAALLSAGVDALGLSGEDGALIRARVGRGGALGRVGEVERVRGELLRRLLEAGVLPVVSPVSRGEDGEPLNVNADDAAAAVAEALGAAELLLVSNVPGVLHAGAVLPSLAAAEVEALIADGVATGGMAPKLRAAARTVAAGVGAVRIGGLEMLADPAAGTRIYAG